MDVTETRGYEGSTRSDASDATSAPHLRGIQEGGGAAGSDAETLVREVEGDGLPMRGSGFAAAFQVPDWKPHGYQARGINWLAGSPESALFFPPGLGKTSTSLAASVAVSGALKRRVRMLVLAPLKVCQTTWMDEPTKWQQFQHLKVGLAHGPDKHLILNDDFYDIVVMNYDGLAWAQPLMVTKQGHRIHNFDIILFDELTRVKNHASQRFKLLKPLLPTFTFRWGLTGTPAANGLLDLFGQVYALDLGKLLGRYVTHYRLKWFYKKPGDEFRWHITEANAKILTDKVGELAMYVKPEEWLELPELITIPIDVELDKKAKEIYNGFEEDFLVKIDDGAITAANAGVLSSKLRQFVGGAVYREGGEEWEVFHSTKLDALESLVEELNGEPLLVAYNFDHERVRILERFPEALCIKGGMSSGQTQQVISAWNAGMAPILLVQPQAAAHGLNLQFGGSCMCWFSLTFNLEDYLQLIARIYRQGQVNRVRNYVLLAKGTIDKYVFRVLNAKDSTQNTFFETLLNLGKNKS